MILKGYFSLVLATAMCLKNMVSQFLARKLGKNGEVPSSYLKKYYEIQKGWLVKPVRCLTKKHV